MATKQPTIKVKRVIKVTNQGYLPSGTRGMAFGKILGEEGYLVIWDHNPEVPLPIPAYDIELIEDFDIGEISVGSRLDYNIDSYRNLPESFGVSFFK